MGAGLPQKAGTTKYYFYSLIFKGREINQESKEDIFSKEGGVEQDRGRERERDSYTDPPPWET